VKQSAGSKILGIWFHGGKKFNLYTECVPKSGHRVIEWILSYDHQVTFAQNTWIHMMKKNKRVHVQHSSELVKKHLTQLTKARNLCSIHVYLRRYTYLAEWERAHLHAIIIYFNKILDFYLKIRYH
jgi:hypothetical protein